MSTETSRPAIGYPEPSKSVPGGNQDTETRPRTTVGSSSKPGAPGGANDTRPAIGESELKTDTLGGENSRQAMVVAPSNVRSPAGVDARPTIHPPAPLAGTLGGAGRQSCNDTHTPLAVSDQPADRQQRFDTHALRAVGSQPDGQGAHDAQSGTAVDQPGPVAAGDAISRACSLLDPALALAADMLDDIERVRIANENRLRQLTRSVEDKDGEVRGFGLDESHPDVARLAAIVATLGQVEQDATRHLEKVMRRHPLHGWAKSMRGVGDKQVARLLAAIGDPYWRPEIVREDGTVVPAGPRTVSALWAYCGLHTLPVDGQGSFNHQQATAVNGVNFPASHKTDGPQGSSAGRGQLAARHPDQDHPGAQAAGVWVAARRQRGTKANWSTKAKMRAYLIAESCGKQLRKPCVAGEHVEDCQCSPYRLLYERRKAATEGRVHAVECVRCGPSGKPAQPGGAWSDGHRHADALRIVAKEILKDLWREARRIHGGDGS